MAILYTQKETMKATQPSTPSVITCGSQSLFVIFSILWRTAGIYFIPNIVIWQNDSYK